MSTNKVKRVVIGKVVSNVRDKTITVLVQYKVKHPIYKKIIKRSSRIHVHDQENVCQLDDVVKVSETTPFSKTKHWELAEIVKQSIKVD